MLVARTAWPSRAAWSSSTDDRVLTGAYLPMVAAASRAGTRLRSWHRAGVTPSLVYVVVTMIVLLGLLFVPGRVT